MAVVGQLGPWLRLAATRKETEKQKKKKKAKENPEGSLVGGAWRREAGLGSESSTGCHPGPLPVLCLL